MSFTVCPQSLKLIQVWERLTELTRMIGFTRTVAEAVNLPTVAVMVQLPAETALTLPPLTEATPLSELDQETERSSVVSQG